ncbi:MAG: hypothetical protein LBD80_06125 [Tannerella sp.]|nr:hypothetical protein [Tannerella sp.]
MAKNRKKRKIQQPAHTGVKFKQTKRYLDMCYATTRQIFRAMGEDESLFDVFTKRQKQEIFRIAVSPPHVAAEPGHKVPRPFIQYIQDHVTMSLKKTYFNEEIGVTWMDMATVGQALLLSFSVEAYTNILQPPQLEVAKRLSDAFTAKETFSGSQKLITSTIQVALMCLSQPNFRIYGLALPSPETSNKRLSIRQTLHITTHDCERLRFHYCNKERVAFRIMVGPTGEVPGSGACIEMSKLFPGIKHDHVLNIYIQSHAIHRLKDRVDTLHPAVRNQIMILSLMFSQRVVRGADGRMYIALVIPADSDARTVGYFAFTIEGNNLLVLTFLPLLSHRMPEGNLLMERLHLSQEDVKYLGMDKLSFFYDVDIDQIPALKQVLYDELHLDYIRTLYTTTREKGVSFNEKRTSFVKDFFRKVEDYSFDSVEKAYAPVAETDVLEDD